VFSDKGLNTSVTHIYIVNDHTLEHNCLVKGFLKKVDL